jgi:hypothetical protein
LPGVALASKECKASAAGVATFGPRCKDNGGKSGDREGDAPIHSPPKALVVASRIWRI